MSPAWLLTLPSLTTPFTLIALISCVGPAVQPEQGGAELVVSLLPPQGTRADAAAAPLGVLRDPVVLGKLLAIGDHRRARACEQGDRVRLGAVPLETACIVACAGLPSHGRVVVV